LDLGKSRYQRTIRSVILTVPIKFGRKLSVSSQNAITSTQKGKALIGGFSQKR
jgi:hypothetical protein